jgi:hypothetical protein
MGDCIQDHRELQFQRQSVARPEPNFSGGVDDCDCSSLVSKIQSGESNGSLATDAIIGGINCGSGFRGTIDRKRDFLLTFSLRASEMKS